MFLFTSLVLLLAMALVLFTKRSVLYKANAFLACSYIALAYLLFYSLMFRQHQMVELPMLRHSQVMFFYFSGPCLHFYVSLTTGSPVLFNVKNALHLLSIFPGLVYFVYGQLQGYKESISADLLATPIILFFGFAILLFYIVSSCRLIANYATHGDESECKLLQWLKTLLPVYAILSIIVFVLATKVQLPLFVDYSMQFVVCLLLIILFLRQSHHSELFSGTVQTQTTNGKYANSSLSEWQLNEYAQRLQNLLTKNECYLNPGLTRDELASMVGIPPHQLSQVLSQKIGSSFNDFINQYRVIRAVELLYQPGSNRYTIESIAIESGFRNRMTFFSVFKKHTGKSPAKYRDDSA